MYSALTVAQYIVDRCNAMGAGVSNLKLQKILYFVQAQFLVSTGAPCFSDEIEAWDFGPVVPSVYRQYKIFGSSCIPVTNMKSVFSGCEEIEDSAKKIIDYMITATAQYSAARLVEITHQQDPWKSAYVKGCNIPISNKAIQTFFEVT